MNKMNNMKNVVAAAALALATVGTACSDETEPASLEGTFPLTIQAVEEGSDVAGFGVRNLRPLAPSDVQVFAGYVDRDGVAQIHAVDGLEAVDDKSVSVVVELGQPDPAFLSGGRVTAFVLALEAGVEMPADGDLTDFADDTLLDLRQPRYIDEPGEGEERGLEVYGYNYAELSPAAGQGLTERFHRVD